MKITVNHDHRANNGGAVALQRNRFFEWRLLKSGRRCAQLLTHESVRHYVIRD